MRNNLDIPHGRSKIFVDWGLEFIDGWIEIDYVFNNISTLVKNKKKKKKEKFNNFLWIDVIKNFQYIRGIENLKYLILLKLKIVWRHKSNVIQLPANSYYFFL